MLQGSDRKEGRWGDNQVNSITMKVKKLGKKKQKLIFAQGIPNGVRVLILIISASVRKNEGRQEVNTVPTLVTPTEMNPQGNHCSKWWKPTFY